MPVLATAAMHDAGDGARAVVPALGGRPPEGDDDLLAGQQALIGLDQHPPGRQVEDATADEPEVALAHDLARGPDVATENGTLAIRM